MSRLRENKPSKRGEPTIALINVVFLLLVFFLVAGTLTQPLGEDIELIEVETKVDSMPENVISISKYGDIKSGNASVELSTIEPANETDTTLRLAPDRNLAATEFVQILQELQGQGWANIVLFAEKAERDK